MFRFVYPLGAAAARFTAPLRDVAVTSVGELQRADVKDRLMAATVTTPVALTGIVAVLAAGVEVPPIVRTDATDPVTVNVRVPTVVAVPVGEMLKTLSEIVSL